MHSRLATQLIPYIRYTSNTFTAMLRLLFVLILIFVLFINTVSSQFIIAGEHTPLMHYTDIKDTLIDYKNENAIKTYTQYESIINHFIDIDLNLDGTNDFRISNSYEYGPGFGGGGTTKYIGAIKPLYSNAYVIKSTEPIYTDYYKQNSTYSANKFNYGDTIIKNDKLYSLSNKGANFWAIYYAGPSSYYEYYWKNAVDNYVGICITSDKDTAYGWIRIAVSELEINKPFLTIKEYAIQNTPITNVNFNTSQNLAVFPNPTNDGNIFIDYGTMKSKAKATIINSLGQVIIKKEFESTDIINVKIDSPPGVYFLQITDSSGEVRTVKIIKE